ncbi:MAG: metallophosphoesterase [Bacteroidales bacterium]|nr:metallophosphoesterase [Bacteroidales bacterium]
MGNLKKYTAFLLICGLVVSCDVDFSGFIRSTDRVEERFEQSVAWNLSHPAQNLVSSSDDYTLLAASDLHIGGIENAKTLLNIYRDSADLALVLVGDIVSGKKEDYDQCKSITDSFPKPLFMMTGNHDLYFDGWKSFYNYFGSSTYYFTVTTPDTADLYICLDSGGGTYGKSQIAWLEDLLVNERSKYRHCVVFSHVNMLRTRRTTSANPMVEEVAFLINLFTEYNVGLVVNGHDHLQDKTVFGSTTYIILDALVDSYENAGFMQIKVDNEKTDTEFFRLSE